MDEAAFIDLTRAEGYHEWLAEQPDATVFHTSHWARVLSDTYAHQPHYLSVLDGQRHVASLPLMEVNSRWTGRRGVSLPFTDLCGQLGEDGKGRIVRAALQLGQKRAWRYVEFRGPVSRGEEGVADFPPEGSVRFWGHEVPTEGSVNEIFGGFDDSVRRAVRKAEKAGLRAEVSSAPESMERFYRLHCLTRRRHGVPPQPYKFFESIARNVLACGHGFVVLASTQDKTAAGAVFFNFGESGIYKFGASDGAMQHLRPNNLAMWEGLKACRERGCKRVHLGRTSMGNAGLRRFKLGFGAAESIIEYYRYDYRMGRWIQAKDRAEASWINRLFRLLPMGGLRLAGRVLYPHLS